MAPLTIFFDLEAPPSSTENYTTGLPRVTGDSHPIYQTGLPSNSSFPYYPPRLIPLLLSSFWFFLSIFLILYVVFPYYFGFCLLLTCLYTLRHFSLFLFLISQIVFFFFRGRVCWPLLCICRQFCIFQRCLDSNTESCRAVASRRATNLATHLHDLATHLLRLTTYLPSHLSHLSHPSL